MEKPKNFKRRADSAQNQNNNADQAPCLIGRIFVLNAALTSRIQYDFGAEFNFGPPLKNSKISGSGTEMIKLTEKTEKTLFAQFFEFWVYQYLGAESDPNPLIQNNRYDSRENHGDQGENLHADMYQKDAGIFVLYTAEKKE
uniref:Uncharacterized protein n=1 Tax=Romanomermis culicivorax TaxID=13658 RepID=A0A915JGB4_ROMCU